MFGLFLSQALPLIALDGLLALGYVIVYRATGVLNFSMGGFLLIGAEVGFALGAAGVTALVGYLVVSVTGLVLGAVFYMAFLRRLDGQPSWVPTLVTIAIGFYVIPSVVQYIWGTQVQAYSGSLGFANTLVILGNGVDMTTVEIGLLAVFLIAQLGFGIVDRFTRLGIRMRATARDSQLAAYRGIRVGAILALAWGLSTALAMFVGFASATDGGQLYPAAGTMAISAFPAAMLGGLDSVAGVFVGAVVVGVAVAAISTFGNPNLADVAPYAVLLAVLLVRPWGLFGRPELVDRV